MKLKWKLAVVAVAALAVAVGGSIAYKAFWPKHWSKEFRQDYEAKVGFMLMLSGAGEYTEPLAACFADEMEKKLPEERMKAINQPDAEPTSEEQAYAKAVIEKCICQKVKPPPAFEPGARCNPEK